MPQKNVYAHWLKILTAQISSGEIKPGAALPTETVFAEKHDLSRSTVAKIYNALQEKGMVEKIPGSGTYVRNRPAPERKKIGLLLPGAGESEIFKQINEEIAYLSNEFGLQCLWEGTLATDAQKRKELSLQLVRQYIEQKVDGVLFAPLERVSGGDLVNKNIASQLQRAGIPVVLIDRDIETPPARSLYDLISLDNVLATQYMAKHLLQEGCSQLFFVCRPLSASSVSHRITGFLKALFDNGLPVSQKVILEQEPEEALKLLVSIVRDESGPIGVVCANDSTAAAFLTACKQHQVQVPEKIKVTGFDNMKYAENLYVPLTSYEQPTQQLARVAMEQLIMRINFPQTPVKTILLHGKLIIRESSAN